MNLEIKNGYKIIIEKLEEKLPLERLHLKENAKINLKETGSEGVEWIHIAKDRELRVMTFLDI
jgi:hypothetical protein